MRLPEDVRESPRGSRPAVLSIIAFFIVGGLMLLSVDVDRGRRVAKEKDAALLTAVEVG